MDTPTNPGQTNPGQTNPGQTNPGQTNPGHDKPWTGQTLDTTNPGHDKPWTVLDRGHTRQCSLRFCKTEDLCTYFRGFSVRFTYIFYNLFLKSAV
jgi:hypothetical protein